MAVPPVSVIEDLDVVEEVPIQSRCISEAGHKHPCTVSIDQAYIKVNARMMFY